MPTYEGDVALVVGAEEPGIEDVNVQTVFSREVRCEGLEPWLFALVSTFGSSENLHRESV